MRRWRAALFAPLGARRRIFAEHAFARARSVHGDQVEIVFERSEMRRVVVGHHDVSDPPFDRICGQYRSPLADHLVGDDQAFGSGQGRKKRRLASGSRAQVEYPQRRFGVGYGTENSLQKHRARLLHVVSSAVQRRVERK